MDITLDISRLQGDYETAMKWAGIYEGDKEKQAQYLLDAARAQNQLCTLVPDQAMKARYAKERDRLILLASQLKGIEIPSSAPGIKPTGTQTDTKNTGNSVVPPVKKTPDDKTKLEKTIEKIESDFDLSNCRYTDPNALKLGFSDLDDIDELESKVKDFFKRREEKKQYQKLDEAAKEIKSIEPKLNMLVYGPPGTGKSSFLSAIGKFVLETQDNSVFFMLTPDVFRSKYHGDSEKIIAQVFAEARSDQYKNALICIDEISTLCPKNKENLHDADRATLNTFLNEADGVKKQNGAEVILIAGTNYPWDIDDAALSRLSERLYLPLPTRDARKNFFLGHARSYLADNPEGQERVANYLADKLEHAGYREMNQVAGLLSNLCWKKTTAANPDNKEISIFIPATAEELEQIIKSQKIKYVESYIHRLEDPNMWDDEEFKKYLGGKHHE